MPLSPSGKGRGICEPYDVLYQSLVGSEEDENVKKLVDNDQQWSNLTCALGLGELINSLVRMYLKRQQCKQEILVHAPKLWAEKISMRALIIVSIHKW